MQIDFTQAITAETKAQAAALARATTIKADCRARILAVGSEATQMNIAQAGIVFTAAVLDGIPRADALAASGLQEGDLTLAWATDDESLRKQTAEQIQARYDAAGFATRYYNPEVHVASFALPNYVKVLMK